MGDAVIRVAIKTLEETVVIRPAIVLTGVSVMS